MNKKFILKCVSILLTFSILLPSYTSTLYAKSNDCLPDSPYSTKKHVVVSSDPRVEMISIMQMMIGAWPMTDLDFDYLREVQETFFKHYNHPAIRMFGFMWYNYNFSQEIPSTFMLHLSDPPELKIQTPFTREIIERGGGERNLNDFLELLRDFAKETKFMDFYRDHLEFYQTIAERVEKKLGTKNTIGMLEDYFGFTNKNYELILVALFCEEGYGTHVDNKYFALLGPYDVDEKKGEKKPYWAGPDELHKQLLKSFSHAYINPIVFKDQKRVETTDKLFSPISLPMRYQRILNWKNCIIEHLVRSVSQSFTLWEYGKDEWEVQRLNDVHDSFAYIDYTSDWLHIYETNRDFYTNFEEFYPVVFDNLRKLCEFPLIATQVSIENESENGVQLSWKDNTTEPGSLLILRKNSNGKYETIHEQENRDLTVWTDRNVGIGDVYWYKIAIRGSGGTIKSNAIKAIIPSYPPLSPENITFTQDKSTIIFSFEYPYKAEGFTLFEFADNDKKEIMSIDFSDEIAQEITLEEVQEGTHVYYICAYITVQNKELENEKLYSTESNFISVTIP